MKRFYLHRDSDASGVSGTGNIAEGCEFDTGWCALVWLTDKASMAYYHDIMTLEAIHGHGGMTKVIWVDDESSNATIRIESTNFGPKAIIVKSSEIIGKQG